MSPIDVKYANSKITKQENTEIKKAKHGIKFTPLKDIMANIKQNHNSADKANKRSINIVKQQIEEGIKIKDPNKENIDYKLIKVSQSAEKRRKFVSKIKPDNRAKEVVPERSPLIPNNKIDGDMLSPESSELEHNIIPDFDLANRSLRSNRTFSPRKALDFADKDADYKGRNLFEDNYQ